LRLLQFHVYGTAARYGVVSVATDFDVEPLPGPTT
jgi:hypothetical protein